MVRLLFECALRSTLIAVFAGAVLSAMRIKNVAARHRTWTSVLVFMLALPLLVASGRSVPLRILPPVRQDVEQVAQLSPEKVPFIRPKLGQALTQSPKAETTAGNRTVWPQWIEGIYLLGFAVSVLRLLTGMIGSHCLERQARRVDGRLTSRSCSSPITVGWVHAITILPEGWQEWEPAKLDAVLIHEREHARRRDPLVQWLALVNRAVFWFHPLAWWLECRIAALSEEACDFAVLERGHDAGDYCEYLLDLARSVSDSHHRIRLFGMAMPGAYLPQRIQKMLRGSRAPKVPFLRMAFASAVFFVLSVGFSTGTPAHTRLPVAATAERKVSPVQLGTSPAAEASRETATEKREQVATPAPIPKFDIPALEPDEVENLKLATFRRNPAGLDAPYFDFSYGNNFKVTAASLVDLIRYAYDRFNSDPGGEILKSQVKGGPAWTATVRYDISFPVDGPSIHDTLSFHTRAKLMLRALLSDRFQLTVHWDVQPMPGYVLAVAPDGPKLQEFTEWNWLTWLTRPNTLGPHSFACRPQEQNGQKYIGILSTGTPISWMATCLSNLLGIPVRNETGLAGRYNFRVLALVSRMDSESRYPTIFDVLHNQLGLELQAREIPTEIILIDSAVMPY